MVKRHSTYLDQAHTLFSCSTCHSHLVSQKDIISRAFQGRVNTSPIVDMFNNTIFTYIPIPVQLGPAFLVKRVVNIFQSKEEERMLMTGIHTVADISCDICKSKIGWIYIKSPEKTQKYKEGKFIIEKLKVIKEVYT